MLMCVCAQARLGRVEPAVYPLHRPHPPGPHLRPDRQRGPHRGQDQLRQAVAAVQYSRK